MTSPLRILLLEDSVQDAELIQELLEADHFVCDVTRVQTRAEFLAALEGRCELTWFSPITHFLRSTAFPH